MELARDDLHAQTERLEKTGVVGCLRFLGVGPPERPGPEGLRRLHRHQLTAVERLDDMTAADTL